MVGLAPLDPPYKIPRIIQPSLQKFYVGFK